MAMWPNASTRECWWRMWFARISRRRAWRKGAGRDGDIFAGLVSCLETCGIEDVLIFWSLIGWTMYIFVARKVRQWLFRCLVPSSCVVFHGSSGDRDI
jgi:hypothetical protein